MTAIDIESNVADLNTVALTEKLKEIETRGFVVIRDFLTPDELRFIEKDYHEASGAENTNYAIAFAGQEVLERLYDKVKGLSTAVGKVTSTHVDTDQGLIYFSITKGINFPWHQDHECFYMNQNHIDYLNFYMVISKEKVEEANLRVIPFDKLRERSPEIYRKVVGSGANWYTIRDGRTEIFSDEEGASVGTIPFDISTLAEIPYLKAGDLLLLRGDVIHSTQAANSARVALSFRMVSSSIPISLKRLVNGARPKMVMMINHRRNYNRIFNAFKKLNVTVASNAALKEKIMQDNSPAPSKLRFILRIVGLRLKLLLA